MDDVSAGSHVKAWFQCEVCGHEWETQIISHAQGKSGCSQCYAKTRKYKSYVSDSDMAAYWSPKNDADASTVSGVEETVLRLWECPKGHSWELNVNAQKKRMKNAKDPCPICSGRRKRTGSNQLVDYPDVLAQWSSELNGAPDNIKTGSNKMFWWECEKGHRWQQKPNVRFSKQNVAECPSCKKEEREARNTSRSGTQVRRQRKPAIVTSWDSLVSRKPSLDKLFGSRNEVEKSAVTTLGQKLWWECDNGHQWESSVSNVLYAKRNGCPYCTGLKVLRSESMGEMHPKLAAQWSHQNDKSAFEVSPSSAYRAWWECENQHEWETAVYARTKGGDNDSCPMCQGSAPENALVDAIQPMLGDRMVVRDRKLISPYELDIVVPDVKIAIEFNGLYWHSEKHHDRSYHHKKWQMARDAGYQLITIWEDDWEQRPDVVTSLLLHKLGVSKQRTVYGRKTTVAELAVHEAHKFVDENHIQGHSRSTGHIGLKEGETLVAVMSYSLSGATMSIDRYCTSAKVVGGFTKLLAHLERANPGIERIITFADHEISTGALYENNGFTVDAILKPDYKYIFNHARVHKFNYRKKRFKNDPRLHYEEGKTERELADLNKILRVWDCGKTRYIKRI